MNWDILIGLGVLAAGVAIWWGYTHQKPGVPATSPKAIVDTVSAGLADSWAELKKDLPGIISARVLELETDLAAALQRAADAEASLAKEQAAKQAAIGAVATAGAALDSVRAQPGFTPPPGAT